MGSETTEMSSATEMLALYDYFNQYQTALLFQLACVLCLVGIVVKDLNFSQNWLSGRLLYENMLVLGFNVFQTSESDDFT